MNLPLLEKWFLWLAIYSVVGWLYESFICSVEQKEFINRGFLNGPYCPIYGCGALLVLLILGRIENPFLLFFLGALVTCTLEYLTSCVMEKIFHARWWDYSDKKFNINGRVCLLGAAVFGTLSVLLIKVIHPAVAKYTGEIPPLALHLVAAAFLCIFAADLIITITGFSGFNEKLGELAALFEQKKNSTVEKARNLAASSSLNFIHEAFIDKLNKQQKRMMKAFPKLKSIRYNKALSEVQNLIRKVKRCK